MAYNESELYPPVAGSPYAYLAEGITISQTSIRVTNPSALAPGPATATIGTDEYFETIFYEDIAVDVLTGVARQIEGTARAWNPGVAIACGLTAQMVRALQTQTKALIAAVAAISPALVDDPNPTLGANLNAAGFAILNALLGTDLAAAGYKITNVGIENYYEKCVVANSGTAYTFNLANGNTFAITMTGNCLFTMPALPAAGSGKSLSFTVWLIQDATGSRTITFPAANVAWRNGVVPSWSTVANRVDKVVFSARPGATKWDGDQAGVNYS